MNIAEMNPALMRMLYHLFPKRPKVNANMSLALYLAAKPTFDTQPEHSQSIAACSFPLTV